MYRIEQTDCFEWLRQCSAESWQAVCTDPPYGVLEFTGKEIAKLRAGRGGVWRLPPKVGGSHRDPLPRFTVLTEEQKQHLRDYFRDWGKLVLRAVVPSQSKGKKLNWRMAYGLDFGGWNPSRHNPNAQASTRIPKREWMGLRSGWRLRGLHRRRLY